MRPHSIDKLFMITVFLLIAVGFFIFTSASLGLLAREGAHFGAVALKQFVFGLCLGGVALVFASAVSYQIWRKYSFYIFVFSILLTLLVFIPGVGFEHGGAKRWIALAGFSFQPSELLKIAYVFYLATWLTVAKERVGEWKYGLIPFSLLTGIVGMILLAQPDTDTFLIAVAAGLAMFIVAGAKIRDLAILGGVGIVGLTGLVFMRPYLMSRIMTFLSPAESDLLGAGYQINQSLIAIGSGGIFGRGFGQSLQKFEFLPEPIGDSIFAVAGEEFGFMGASLLIFLFIFFALRGFRIAARAPDSFGGLVAVGIVILITCQSFLNIGSMLALVPLSGTPLVFVSQGGTALLLALFQAGILFNISKYQRV